MCSQKSSDPQHCSCEEAVVVLHYLQRGLLLVMRTNPGDFLPICYVNPHIGRRAHGGRTCVQATLGLGHTTSGFRSDFPLMGKPAACSVKTRVD